MTELSEQQTTCTRCHTDYSKDPLELLIMGESGICQVCTAQLSGKYADGQGKALADLIVAARDLRQASKDYDDSNDCGKCTTQRELVAQSICSSMRWITTREVAGDE